MPDTYKEGNQITRDGLTLAKVIYLLLMPFRPNLLKPYMAFDHFTEVPIEQLKLKGIQGVLIDADGTLGPHHSRIFSHEVIEHVNKMVTSGLKVAIYTNSFENRFQQFTDITVVTDVPPKPDRRGFKEAMEVFLGLKNPNEVCMIGDNFITDGGARLAGMYFIHIHPIKGDEPFIHSFTRKLAFQYASFYFPRSFP
jgi:HAD superfamily phosphatase (TIGR01668 family)